MPIVYLLINWCVVTGIYIKFYFERVSYLIELELSITYYW